MKPCPWVSMKYMMGRGSWNCTESWSDVEIWIQDVNVDVGFFSRVVQWNLCLSTFSLPPEWFRNDFKQCVMHMRSGVEHNDVKCVFGREIREIRFIWNEVLRTCDEVQR